MTIVDEDDEERADGGSLSWVAFGGFYEWFRGSGFGLGPSVEYNLMFSQTLTYHGAQLAFRAAYYTGP
jgi:hypothetical protein